MKTPLFCFILSFIITLAFVPGCASSGNGTQMGTVNENKVSSNKYLTLEDYLRRLSNVKVTGQGHDLRVTIRSNMSITNAHEQPLFILNGQNMGNDYGRVARLVSRGSITSVEALPASRASLYGMQGGAGVIIIKTE